MIKPFVIWAGVKAARWFYSGVGSIIALHRVVPAGQRSKVSDNRALEITPDALDATIRYFRNQGCYFASMDEVPALLASGGRSRKFVCFTFDDGYKDTAVQAYPILKRHRIPFAVNVTTSFADQRGMLWWYVLEQVLESRATIFVQLSEGRRELPLASRAEKEVAFGLIAKHARCMDQTKRDEFIREFAGEARLDAQKISNEYLMNWEMIEQLAQDDFVTIGAHSVNHYTMNTLDVTLVRSEISGSKQLIESRLGRPVRHFAYPFGGANAVGPREFQVASACGFMTMATTRCANLFPAHAAYIYCLPRLTLSGNFPTTERLARLESGFEPARLYRARRVITV